MNEGRVFTPCLSCPVNCLQIDIEFNGHADRRQEGLLGACQALKRSRMAASDFF